MQKSRDLKRFEARLSAEDFRTMEIYSEDNGQSTLAAGLRCILSDARKRMKKNGEWR